MKSKKSEPKTTVGDGGKTSDGRFKEGNQFGKGNPLNKKIQQFRAALIAAIGTADMYDVGCKLVEQAKGGDRLAISELLDRTIGRPVQSDVMARLEELEEIVREKLGDERL
jgi:hypothetical protein